ncbi:Histone transcription regulator 3 [Fusarium musae]|uniref:Histone transcription regulator 3 homolog n=1 Tax=Fusarium musae TaxID=1042133 RepID=A0A9P8IL19_9HYPO|nr:Histone transcription regulator 3 [Fusarium musae]KAG9496688.1 Histone transcription regulator 3 [Fusarium musae]
MPAFQAINLEPEDNIDEQIDTTKEIHVDEALKRFQNALKLHAQGPRSREAAETAYTELFESEIFKYREAKTDYERAERHADGQPDVSNLDHSLTDGGLDVDAGGADGVAASLSQALYLSYKNYGQFFVDKYKDESTSNPAFKDKTRLKYHDDHANKVLDSWMTALDQDPSDPELWRRAARFAGAMNSHRLKRFCLEAAIELDDDPAVVEVEPPSLAEGMAGEQLKDQLQLLGDDMALSHPIMAPWLKKKMPALLKRHLDPIPFLPDPTKSLIPPKDPVTQDQTTEDTEMRDAQNASRSDPKTVSSWASLGDEIINRLTNYTEVFDIFDELLDSNVDEAVVETPSNDSESISSEIQVAIGRPIQLAEPSEKSSPEAEPKDQKAASEATEDSQKAGDQPKKETNGVSTRKRSQSAAGLPDGAEEENATEKRSKRVRRRETLHAEESTDPSALIANQLQPYQGADQNLFQMTKSVLENLGVDDKSTFDFITELIDSCAVEDRPGKIANLAAGDLSSAIVDFREEVAKVFLHKNEQAPLGPSSFLEHAKTSSQDQNSTPSFNETQGLRSFATKIGESRSWMTPEDVAYEWVRAVSESYATAKWSDKMKLSVVQMLNNSDAALYQRINEKLELAAGSPEKLAELETIVPMIYELHIDIYELITNPNSVVDYATRMKTKYRLGRWLNVASAYIQALDRPSNDELSARFLWTSVLVSSHSERPVREHILLMWTSLRDHLADEKIPTISLPNNVVMPTISPEAADREISKLTTMDFFLGLFQDNMEDPVSVIETLEPVLNPSSVCVPDQEADSESPGTEDDDSSSSSSSSSSDKQKKSLSDCASQSLQDLWKFLHNSSTELRLFLWSRLGTAYHAIGYPTKQFSCYLKSIELIVSDLEGETYANTPADSRKLLFMRTLKSLDELLISALYSALNDNTAFEIIDDAHIKSATAALAKVNCLLHVSSLCEDEVRIGLKTDRPGNAASKTALQSLKNRLKEMQIRAWCLQYTMFRAGINEDNCIIGPEKDLADFLAAIHQVIGIRKFCKASNKIFLKVMRVELLKLKNIENWEDYLGQVLYDLHGLKLGAGVWEVQDHACPPEKLEKRQTMQLVERVTILANRMPMKDLLKSDLKTTIDHMQQTLGQAKSTSQMYHNLRNFTEYLKRPIHPLRLYRALTGEVSVDAVSVNTPETILATHGWFFLLGMMALTKFKGVDLNRRQTPGATDDLRIGATFLRLQLQFTADRWDAWFRLAECFDYELDESVLWTADKMNKDRPELVKFQRNAIHCYTLALSHSRNVEVETHDGDPLHDLYHKFAMRMYASSREPFAMEPFHHSDQERYFIEDMGAGTFKKILHPQMNEYKVWKFAAKLFRMAMQRKPTDWKNPYMLSKCYWKMYQTSDDQLDVKDMKSKISIELLIQTLQKAVTVAHNARRGRNSDPILEPHYKIVSILHKLVIRGDIPSKDAAAILAEQPFGLPVNPDDHFASFTEPEDWEEYIIRILTKLRDKDKSNWQHRIIIRHARILFDEANEAQGSDRLVEAKAAFSILRDSMVTKTMVMNVWKCDAERPGRHHVYTEQYVRFMTKLLVIMSDRNNLEQLLRRLRKKGADYYHFTDLWQSCCMAYLKLLREGYHVSPVSDDVFKSLSSEEFEVIGERIADWAASDGADIPLFNCMKETIELKKLNANLMKVAPIDDLLNDCYSRIYSEIAKTLPGPDPSKVVEERHHAKEVAAQLEAAQAEAKATSSLANILNAPNGQESITGTATPMETEKHEAAPRARKLGVRRPDVLRKAEQAVVRALEAPKSNKSRVGSVSSGKRGSHTPIQHASDAGSDEEADAQIRREAGHDVDVDMKDAGDEHEDEHEDHEEEHDEDHEDGADDDNGEEHADDKAESEPGSIHDSADDESDLSDVPEDYDEEVPPGLIFPNLRHHTDESSGEDADSESEGDDEAEESDGEEEAEEVAEEEEEHDESREDGEETLGNEDTELVDGEEEEEEDEVDGDERREDWDADDSVRAEAW